MTGPFAVDPLQFSSLGGERFAAFMRQLLDAELQAHRLPGTALESSARENLSDGGVDSLIVLPAPTTSIPEGVSVWQFKAGDLSPSQCREEIRNASLALEKLAAGAEYVLVLGADLTSTKIDKRKEAILEELTSLGIPVEATSIKILAAETAARWAERYPALTVSRLLNSGAPGAGLMLFKVRADLPQPSIQLKKLI